MSTLSTANIESKAANTPPVIKDSNGTECGQFVRAWASLNHDTVSVVDGFNVASMTDIGTGRFSITFTNAMPNANYAAVGGAGNATGTTSGERSVARDAAWTTTTAAFRVLSGTTNIDDDGISLIFVGG